jgi:thiamine pyrophosphokinase
MLITKCRKIILADGGANHFISYQTNKVEAIIGDLDSIKPSTLKHYE